MLMMNMMNGNSDSSDNMFAGLFDEDIFSSFTEDDSNDSASEEEVDQ